MMQLPCLLRILLIWSMYMGLAEAHTIPTLVVEAEFTQERTALFKVNLDPRLFLTAQPASLPPVPASWWFDQDEKTQAESQTKAGDYINRILAFKIGGTIISGIWKVSPIDSASAFPLEASSAEVHLLAEYAGPLPDTDGQFTLKVSQDCPVALILVNSLEGHDQRQPQSLFAGETSVGFPLPAPVPVAAKTSPYLWLLLLVLPLFLILLRLRKRKRQLQTHSH